ncbi:MULTISPECIES: hypothetical protein [Saccharothrix]|uniref:hypothetical protein n=1 Tax=Saccharothrix TaxID=2071 RepID=UPI001161000C|nr:hypothetical protein [Saccharothrix sp. CB00851]
MAEDGGMLAETGRRISFVAETVGKVAAGVAGDVWANITQTQFSIDIDQAPKLITALESAIEELISAYEDSAELRNMQSPGKDPYSGFAILAARGSAGDQEGGYGWANKEAQKALANTIENVQRAIDEYNQTEQAARDGLKS